MSKRMATIMEIAKRAGVTDATVSRALRNSPLVKHETRERVWQVAREMRYRTNPAGRGLATSKTFTLGLIVPSLCYPMNALMAEHMQRIAAEINHGLLIASLDNHDEQAIDRMKMFRERCVDGIIVLPAMSQKDVSCIEIIRHYGIPFVVSADMPGANVPFASFDNYDGAMQLTRHMFDRGFDRLALVTSWPTHAGTVSVTRGFHDGLRQAGADPARFPVVHQEQFDGSAIKETFERLMNDPVGINGIISSDSVVAMQVAVALKSRGVAIGKTFGLAAGDDAPLLNESCLSVTALRYPMEPLARSMVQMLMRRIDGDDGLIEPEYFKPELIVRASTGEV